MGSFFNNPASTTPPGVVTINQTDLLHSDSFGDWVSSFTIPANALKDGYGLVGGSLKYFVTYTSTAGIVRPGFSVYNTVNGPEADGVVHPTQSNVNASNNSLAFAFVMISVGSQLFANMLCGTGGALTSSIGGAASDQYIFTNVNLALEITVEMGSISSGSVNPITASSTNFTNIYMVPSS